MNLAFIYHQHLVLLSSLAARFNMTDTVHGGSFPLSIYDKPAYADVAASFDSVSGGGNDGGAKLHF